MHWIRVRNTWAQNKILNLLYNLQYLLCQMFIHSPLYERAKWIEYNELPLKRLITLRDYNIHGLARRQFSSSNFFPKAIRARLARAQKKTKAQGHSGIMGAKLNRSSWSFAFSPPTFYVQTTAVLVPASQSDLLAKHLQELLVRRTSGFCGRIWCSEKKALC